MAKILVTGGPVHAKLDAVKIVTNHFKGGRMVALADALVSRGNEVTYLCPPDRRGYGPLPLAATLKAHYGFIDYMEQVQELSQDHDMVILGAAVTNLVPEPTAWSLDEKFPSHDYQEGDLIKIPFRVAPRVINEVKKANPRCTLVGFKLLSDVSDTELLRAAYTIIMDAKADLVVANDFKNLRRKLLVTKERSVIEVNESIGKTSIIPEKRGLADFLDAMARDKHYATVWWHGITSSIESAKDRYYAVVREHRERIVSHGTVGDRMFGCVAVRVKAGGFLCSPRSKNTIYEHPVYVRKVCHSVRHVMVSEGVDYLDNDPHPKASLNAPLLASIFESRPEVHAIVHTHQTGTGLSVLPYAPPGTARDSQRKLLDEDFEIEHHGVFLMLPEEP